MRNERRFVRRYRMRRRVDATTRGSLEARVDGPREERGCREFDNPSYSVVANKQETIQTFRRDLPSRATWTFNTPPRVADDLADRPPCRRNPKTRMTPSFRFAPSTGVRELPRRSSSRARSDLVTCIDTKQTSVVRRSVRLDEESNAQVPLLPSYERTHASTTSPGSPRTFRPPLPATKDRRTSHLRFVASPRLQQRRNSFGGTVSGRATTRRRGASPGDVATTRPGGRARAVGRAWWAAEMRRKVPWNDSSSLWKNRRRNACVHATANPKPW